jgi:hypothetical protein
MKMILHILQDRTLKEAQDEFSSAYPFLRIEFYRSNGPGIARRHLKNSMMLAAAGLKGTGEIELNDLMTVGQLEDIFQKQFGLQVQVSRRSGTLWLETTMTDNWTLKQQNDHGRELSEPANISSVIKREDIDED